MASFEAQVDFLVKKTENNMLIVAQASIQDVVNNAQRPREKGGRMPIDTGFLRTSGQASLDGLPSGPTRGDKNATAGQYDDGSNAQYPVGLTLAGLSLGKTFWFGWTADYATIQNLRTGFLDVAVQRWQEFVDRNVLNLNALARGSQSRVVRDD